jgi:hypothetical protein
MSKSLSLFFSLFVFAALSADAARAGELTWRFTNESPYRAQIDFKAEHGNRWWPGRNRAFTLNDGDQHTFSLNCRAGEKICYGAWTAPHSQYYWGAGPRHDKRCRACCAVCGEGDAQPVTLTLKR